MITKVHKHHEKFSLLSCTSFGVGWGDGSRATDAGVVDGFNQEYCSLNGNENGYTPLRGIVYGCGCYLGSSCDEGFGRG